MGERPRSVFSGSGRGQFTAPAASTPGDLTALWWEGRGTAACGSSTRHLLLTGQALTGLFSGCPSPGLWGPAETSRTLTPILPLNFRYTRRPPTLKAYGGHVLLGEVGRGSAAPCADGEHPPGTLRETAARAGVRPGGRLPKASPRQGPGRGAVSQSPPASAPA